ncbi:alpha-amylase family glycosyl hydrolase [Microbacter margulisiae]|uniref:Glycosidase n=1 Tax=Microbacter margulisiae TaxID=1350067 RepID=A0A7W5DQY5_9PORP|nr:alpha-amylase family glycosyl hydrolase [Microbacter margulisiae]MBB3187110.1 glycosidase [Microbacter margulisiae]
MSSKMIIYQILPRLFGNTHDRLIHNGDIESNGCGKFQDITSKTLQEIKKLGITHIWYTGIIEHASQTDYSAFGITKDHSAIVKGKAGSPYAIKDYYDVDPDLAVDVTNRMHEFEALIERTHMQDIKVLIDFVPNHVARQYHSDAKPADVFDLGELDNQKLAFDSQNNFYYLPGELFAPQMDLTGDEQSPYVESPAKATGNDQFTSHPTIYDWYETVKLNYGVDYVNGKSKYFDPIPDTWQKMRSILLFWAQKNIDGFRCDMAEMVPVEFWSWVIPQVKAKFPDIVFIAEIYTPSSYRHFIEIGKFDFLYDKVGMYDTLRAITTDFESARDVSVKWQQVSDILPHMLFFLENHDEQRIASRFFAGDPLQAVPAMIIAATLSVSPVMIYFGQELGERGSDVEGFSGDDGRTTIFDYWSMDTVRRWYNKGNCDGALLTEQERDLRNFYQKLLNISQDEKAIAHGEMFDLMYVNYENQMFNVDKQFAYLRKAGDELILICVNFDALCSDILINIPQHAFHYLELPEGTKMNGVDLLSGEQELEQEFSSHTPYSMHLNAFSGKILKMKWAR